MKTSSSLWRGLCGKGLKSHQPVPTFWPHEPLWKWMLQHWLNLQMTLPWSINFIVELECSRHSQRVWSVRYTLSVEWTSLHLGWSVPTVSVRCASLPVSQRPPPHPAPEDSALYQKGLRKREGFPQDAGRKRAFENLIHLGTLKSLINTLRVPKIKLILLALIKRFINMK